VKGQNVALLVDASDSNCGYGRLQLFQESLAVGTFSVISFISHLCVKLFSGQVLVLSFCFLPTNYQSRSQRFVPLDQRSENESSGNEIDKLYMYFAHDIFNLSLNLQ